MELDDALGEHLKKQKRKREMSDDEHDEEIAFDDAVLVCSMASVITIGRSHGGLPTGMVTFDIGKDPRIPVGIDGMIKIHADGIHESSQVKGQSEDEKGSLVLRRRYLHKAVKKGWI